MTKILVVSDSAVDASTTIRAVRYVRPESHILAAIDTDHAIELMANTMFDLILLDLSMPRMDGMGLLKRMRQSAARQTVVIAVSRSRSISAQVDATALGIVDFVYKSINFDEFAVQLYTAMSRLTEPKHECLPEN
jgi:DNA-binding response OmpR family regulator